MAGGFGRHGGVYRAAAHHFVLGAYLQNEKENVLNEKKEIVRKTEEKHPKDASAVVFSGR